MEIKINLLEVASELANNELIKRYGEDDIYLEAGEVITYKDAFQEQFNELYDYYYNLILKLQIKE